MSTQITVAVSADGEVLEALAMREGARADRLDSEANQKAASQAAADALDDETNGRENKLGKFNPSRDPAAFARKKKEEPVKGQFGGINIFYQHFPLNENNVTQKDGSYMWLNLRGVEVIEDDNGFVYSQLVEENVELKLIRNNNVDVFNVEKPPEYEFERYWQDNFMGRDAYIPFEDWPAYYDHDAYWQKDFNGKPISANISNDEDRREVFLAIPYESRYERLPDDRMDVEGSSGITIWQSRKDDATLTSLNLNVNGRFFSDDELSGFINHVYDPIQEVFLLPYKDDIFFVFVVYTDYNIGSTYGFEVSGTCTSALSDTHYPLPSGLGSYFGPATNTKASVSRGTPRYKIPDGYEFPSFDFGSLTMVGSGSYPSPKITEAGANKIQQTYLYKVENGKITPIEVPERLRVHATDLQTNLNGVVVPNDPYTMFSGKAGYDQEAFYQERFYWPRIDRPTYLVDGNSSTVPRCELGILNMFSYDEDAYLRKRRKYVDNLQRDRSASKGYGFGRITTDNHFETPFIEKKTKGFYDDKYFTPMVYQYILGRATPSLNYNQTAVAMWPDPETGFPFVLPRFMDFDGYGKVRAAEEGYNPVKANQPYDGELGEWVEAPQLRNATHYCWNWNRPDMCWDKLIELGLPVSVLGSRPEKPNE